MEKKCARRGRGQEGANMRGKNERDSPGISKERAARSLQADPNSKTWTNEEKRLYQPQYKA